MGSSEKNGDYAPSILCLSCETLMIVSSKEDAVIGSACNQKQEFVFHNFTVKSLLFRFYPELRTVT